MISLYQLLTERADLSAPEELRLARGSALPRSERTNCPEGVRLARDSKEEVNKRYELMNDKLTDFLSSVYIDIVNGHRLTRWCIMKDEYEKYNEFVKQFISDMMTNLDDVDKMN